MTSAYDRLFASIPGARINNGDTQQASAVTPEIVMSVPDIQLETEIKETNAKKDLTPYHEIDGLPDWMDKVVSTPDYYVYIHKTLFDTAKQICNTQFNASGIDLSGTATGLGMDKNKALAVIRKTHQDGHAAVVIHIPSSIVGLPSSTSYTASIFEVMTGQKPAPQSHNIGELVDEAARKFLLDPEGKQVVIPKEWVYGFIDDESLGSYVNPNYDSSLPLPGKGKTP